MVKVPLDNRPVPGTELLSRLVEELDVEFAPSEDNLENVPTIEIEFAGTMLELVVGKTGGTLRETGLVESDINRAVDTPADARLGDVGLRLSELRAIDTLEEGASDR